MMIGIILKYHYYCPIVSWIESLSSKVNFLPGEVR